MRHKSVLPGPFTVTTVNLTEGLRILILVLTLIIVACGIIYSKHYGRMQHEQAQELINEKEKQIKMMDKLVLEKATWMSDLRVESIAKTELQMVMPDQKVEMIKP